MDPEVAPTPAARSGPTRPTPNQTPMPKKPTPPDPTLVHDPAEALRLLRRDGARLTGLPDSPTRPGSVRAARVEVPVEAEAAALAVLSGGLRDAGRDGSRTVWEPPPDLGGLGTGREVGDVAAPPAAVAPMPASGDGGPGGARLFVPTPSLPGSDGDLVASLLENAPGRTWAGVVDVDAATARAWLDRNTDNRPLRRDTVLRYRRLMEQGRWMLSTDAVGFDATGRLVNGQHRLTAAAEHAEAAQAEAAADGPPLTVPFLVATGLSEAVFAVLDGGKPRSGSDVLAIRGFAYSASSAAVARHGWWAQRGRLWRKTGRVELDDLVAYAEAHRDEIQSAVAGAERLYQASRQAGGVLRHSHAAFCLFAFRDVDGRAASGAGSRVEGFLSAVATGLGIAALDEPAHVVRQAFLDDQRADVAMGSEEALAILIRGAQHAALGQPMNRARGRGAGAWPSLEVGGWPKQDPAPKRGDRVAAAEATTGTIDDPEVRHLG